MSQGYTELRRQEYAPAAYAQTETGSFGRQASILPEALKPAGEAVNTTPQKGPPWFLMCTSFAVLVSLNLLLIYVAHPKFENPDPEDDHVVQLWEPYLVMNGVAVSMFAMALGLPADLLLFGLSSMFSVVGIINSEELLGGLGNSGVVAVATLCIVSKAIDQTKALKGIMSGCLGSPKSTWMAMLRMAFPVVSLGTVFNNTPLVAVMIPIVKDWTKATGLQASHFMMPLSFVTMLSACITTMGSSTNLLAVQLVPEAKIAFLDLAPGGLVIMVVGVAYCCLLAPVLLPSNTPAAAASEKSETVKALPESIGDGTRLASLDGLQPSLERYTVYFELQEGPLIGRGAAACGLVKALSPPAAVRCIGSYDNECFEPGDKLAVINATAEEISSLSAVPGLSILALGERYISEAHSVNRRASYVREQERTRRFGLPVRKWIAANLQGGWEPSERGLYEVIIPPGGLRKAGRSSTVGQVTLEDLQQPLSDWNCILIAVQGTHPQSDETIPMQGGEIILVQALSKDFADMTKTVFKRVLGVPEASPPVGLIMSPLDPLRPAISVLGLAACVVLSAFNIAPLVPTAILIGLSSIVMGTLSMKDFYGAINGPVLLTVAGSFGVGAAFAKTGVATCLARSVLSVVADSGPFAVLGAIVMLALALGVIVSNNTTIILLAPMVKEICHRQNMDLKMAMVAVIYAANLSFATPFSYQTNMMVMPHGGYEFLDYVKFGVPMMLLCGIVALVMSILVYGGD